MSATTSAQAAITSLASLPSVDTIFNTARQLASLNQSQLFDGTSLNPNLYLNTTFDNGLTWPIGFLWPQLEVTGVVEPINCTVNTCSLVFGSFLYLPNVAANAFFAALFGLVLVASTVLSIRGRNWGYMVGMVGGLLLEILGYIGRIMLHNDDFSGNPFYIYIICLTIGPAFLSASIYLCLARIVAVYGSHLSRFRPKTYTKIFVGCDFLSLVLQGTGGGMAASFDAGTAASKAGLNTMIAGLAFQVISLSIFIGLCTDLALRIHRKRDATSPEYREFRHSAKFRGFLAALGIATLTIFIRSVFRVAELQAGLHSKFANEEITFMVLEAGMIGIAVVALLAYHPDLVFGRQMWADLSADIKVGGGSAILRSKESVSSDVELTGQSMPFPKNGSRV